MKKRNKTDRYRYVYPDPAGNPEHRFLVCPKCGEMLLPVDIEDFSACPYCGTHLEFSGDLENFILAPVISGWIRTLERQSGVGSDSFHIY